jgi:hypothetical protein
MRYISTMKCIHRIVAVIGINQLPGQPGCRFAPEHLSKEFVRRVVIVRRIPGLDGTADACNG